MDVWQIRVRFFALKTVKSDFLASKVCKGCHFQAIRVSNLRKIIVFLDQITDILRNFFNNAKNIQLEIHFPAFWGIYFRKFFVICLRRVQNFAEILVCTAKGKGLKVPDPHP